MIASGTMQETTSQLKSIDYSSKSSKIQKRHPVFFDDEQWILMKRTSYFGYSGKYIVGHFVKCFYTYDYQMKECYDYHRLSEAIMRAAISGHKLIILKNSPYFRCSCNYIELKNSVQVDSIKRIDKFFID